MLTVVDGGGKNCQRLADVTCERSLCNVVQVVLYILISSKIGVSQNMRVTFIIFWNF